MELLFFLCGIVIGCILTLFVLHMYSGHGYFKLEKYSDEDGIYTINVRLPPDQNLDKKKKVVLSRE